MGSGLRNARDVLALRVHPGVVVVRRHLSVDLELDRGRDRVRGHVMPERLVGFGACGQYVRPRGRGERGGGGTQTCRHASGAGSARAHGGEGAEVHRFGRDVARVEELAGVESAKPPHGALALSFRYSSSWGSEKDSALTLQGTSSRTLECRRYVRALRVKCIAESYSHLVRTHESAASLQLLGPAIDCHRGFGVRHTRGYKYCSKGRELTKATFRM